MYPQVVAFLHNSIVHSIFTGWMAAAGTDLRVLYTGGQQKGWTVFKTFDWNIASFRWLAGAMIGLLTGLGLSFVS